MRCMLSCQFGHRRFEGLFLLSEMISAALQWLYGGLYLT